MNVFRSLYQRLAVLCRRGRITGKGRGDEEAAETSGEHVAEQERVKERGIRQHSQKPENLYPLW